MAYGDINPSLPQVFVIPLACWTFTILRSKQQKRQSTRPNFTDNEHDNCVETVLRRLPSRYEICYNKPTASLSHNLMSLPPRQGLPRVVSNRHL